MHTNSVLRIPEEILQYGEHNIKVCTLVCQRKAFL